MAKLTRSFTETVVARLERDPTFAEALLSEAEEQRQDGHADIAARLDAIARGLADADSGRVKPTRDVAARLTAKYQGMEHDSDQD